MSFLYMINRPACINPPPLFLGTSENIRTIFVEPLPCWVSLFPCLPAAPISIV